MINVFSQNEFFDIHECLNISEFSYIDLDLNYL